MNKVKLLWVIIIVGNLIDYAETLFFSHLEILQCDYNPLILGNTAFLNVFMVLTGVKLLSLSWIYWFTRLFDYLKVNAYKWIGLLPFAGGTVFILSWNLVAVLTSGYLQAMGL
ncbi:hypothetical protein [Sulfuracidifex tepidarius]|uniref:DUF5658 domain-containing protein n=1 Tax=Sulfuracidifex tepidarius TaxID=1294262 RepID=A0A510E126_9CREN|nr:hypothetical protein [Sulfuracidifex tepidarius]BBG26147.1 hypothetical protein IC007_0652 [Sulfuracidifex tepidarius]